MVKVDVVNTNLLRFGDPEVRGGADGSLSRWCMSTLVEEDVCCGGAWESLNVDPDRLLPELTSSFVGGEVEIRLHSATGSSSIRFPCRDILHYSTY